MPRAIFFDMDDTLLDGVKAMNAAWGAICGDVAQRLGADPEALRKAIRHQGGIFWKDEAAVGHWRLDLEGARALVVANALTAEGLDPSGALQIAADYGRLHREYLQPFDDAFATLEAVRAAGLHIGLITNGPRALQRDKIDRFGIEKHMDVIVIEGEFGRGKPDPAVFQHALRTVGVQPAEAWHIGDNLYADVGGAQSVGIHGVWIHRDRLERREDAAAVPDRVIAHLTELPALLAG